MNVPKLIAVVPVRDGVLALGGAEAIAEAGGEVILIGDGLDIAVGELRGIATSARLMPTAVFAPASWADSLARALTGALSACTVVIPGSPDGRDLAPRLAFALGVPHVAGATAVRVDGAVVAHHGGATMHDVTVDGPFVATLQPGIRGVEIAPNAQPVRIDLVASALTENTAIEDQAAESVRTRDPALIALVAADPSTMDLGEAPRLVGAGAGLGSPEAVTELAALAAKLGASLGATRVVTDLGWAPFERQIGTTGVTVNPSLYIAFGVSGAVQHTSGLGQPDHIISVNLDASCPMMSLADLAVVTDAPALVHALLRELTS